MNINRDYLIINDVKKSNVKLDNGSMFFYITDKNTQNIFVNLVINVSNNELIQKYANIENAEDYTLTMNIVKPDNTYKIIEGKLHDKEKAIFEFNLNEDCCDEIGSYKCELLTKCNIDDHEEITTSNKLTYKVKSSVLNDLDDIVEAPQYPLVIQLFDKLSDIEQYEEDRRSNELARQLTEEQRQARFNALDADMTDSIEAMDNKVVDVENRIAAKEEAVDTLIVDTKADIDEYKVAKDQEIDDYKTAKDAEINNAITNQDNKIDTAISEQNDRIALVENNDAVQDNRLDIVENRLGNIGGNIPSNIQSIIDEHTSRLDTIEAIDVAQNNRLDIIEAKNQQQDDRLLDIEKVNKKQDIDIKCLYGFHENIIDITEEGNSIYLQNSVEGHCEIDNIQGNTLVNYNKEPDKELILNGNINTSGDNTVTITEGVDGGLVDVALEGNTLVNVSKTKDSTALPLDEDLTYLYANTQYTIQFISYAAITADITLGGAKLLAQNIVEGLNRISITTPSELVDNKLVINGNSTGANIMEVVVTDIDRELEYFEGMKSVGEGKELQVISINSDKHLANTQRLTHEPLRGTRDAKDKYVLIDGKWYIERKCGIRAYQEGDKDNYKTDLINTIYPLEMPTYEEIDYNPLEVYSGTTHITTNSVIPCNITVKNHGFNCLLKPSTTYTVSSNLGLNTVTTPSVLTEDCLRFMDMDTSNVTTMRDVLVLEGDWTSKPDLIPANFSGIESAFEQEYDVEKGKYKVNVKVANEDKTVENNITFYINEPLRGVGTAKDKVYVNNKVVVERNCGSKVFDGRESWILMNSFPSKIYALSLTNVNTSIMCDKIIPRNYSSSAENYWAILYSSKYLRIQTPISTVGEFKQWLQQNPVTVVYELKEPVYEEVEYNDVKLFIESFKNSTLSYNSNVPVTSTVHYSYSVPIVDTVAQTASISDQQDSMIIDMATQVAVMEMMLM